MVTSINTATANASEVNGSEKATDHSPLANRVTPVTTSTITKAEGAESEGCWSGFVNFIKGIWDWIFCGCGSKSEKSETPTSTATLPAANPVVTPGSTAQPQQASVPNAVQSAAASIQEPVNPQTEPESPYAPFFAPEELGQPSSANPDDIALELVKNASRLESELSEVKAKLDKAEAEGRSDRQYIRDRDVEIDLKDKEVKTGKERIEALEAQITVLAAEKEQLEENFKNAKEEHEKAISDIQSQTVDGKAVMGLQAQLRQVKEKLNGTEVLVQALGAEKDSLAASLKETEESLKEKKAELKDYKAKAETSAQQLQDLQKVAEELKEKWLSLMMNFNQVATSKEGPKTLQGHLHQNMKNQFDLMLSVNNLFKALPSELKESARFLDEYNVYCQRFNGSDFAGYELVPSSLMDHVGVLNSFAMGILMALSETIESPERVEHQKLVEQLEQDKEVEMQEMRAAMQEINSYNKANKVVPDNLFHNIAILSEFLKVKSDQSSSSSSSASASSAESEGENEEEEAIAAAVAQKIADQSEIAVDSTIRAEEGSSVANKNVESENESEMLVDKDPSEASSSEGNSNASE